MTQDERNTAGTPESIVASAALAPVALFVFNRPAHTQRTLEALHRNDSAQNTHLYIFCDGPRADREDGIFVQKVRMVVASRRWCGKVTIVEHKKNCGLAASIKNGINHVLGEHDRVIVLEDDILVSPGFLDYMNTALSIYQSDSAVTAVCGFLPGTIMGRLLPETFFLRHFECWGWGTWRRVWKDLDWDANRLYARVTENREQLDKFDFNNSADFSSHLRANAEGRMRTWAIYFQANAFLWEGLSLFPGKSLVQNIGCDSSGVHCDAGVSQLYSVEVTETVSVKRRKLFESNLGRLYFNCFFRFGKRSLGSCAFLLLLRKLRLIASSFGPRKV